MSRRRALQSLALAGAAAALPRRTAAATPARRLGVALVGLGGYSTDLLGPALRLTRHCRLAGLVTGSPHKIAKWQETYGVPDAAIYGYDDIHRIADNPDIDVVYIATPNHLHKPLTLAAANAGKHVWCEKPMAMDAGEGEAMIRACRDNRVQLAIGYRMQHEPNSRRFMEMARTQPFGGIVQLRADAGWFGWRQGADDAWRLDPARGGGAMYDMGVYCVNASRYSTGLEPVAVRAWDETTRRDIFQGVDETMRFTLEFPGDITAACVTSFGRDLNTLHVDCERGWYELSPFQSYDGNVGRASDGTRFTAQLGASPRMQAEQMDQDALAILEARPPRAPGEEGLRDMRVLDAAFASVRSGGERVRIAG
ncbi:Gfo/Idh/MocA family oxidoreductase [Luteimonas sp. 100069]|uniref:Gfo/Idh/MocA family protein n=1 Tax=Luteimonas sp. 100069 TaxID=2006109 RepID=UPI000F4E9714|nr:Gfo/Idh/MocA family oxidoreductase [Luteimonas sp. 100069]RPD83696.1 gfo/Idh/MocA family oxidoreductase [Luteimonas sp. 100069]